VSARNFFAELKRRNVYRVAVAYAVVSWLVIQVAATIFPAFGAPAWVMKAIISLLASALCWRLRSPGRSRYGGRNQAH
jgi:hypothetical protein